MAEQDTSDVELPKNIIVTLKNRYGSNWHKIVVYVRRDQSKGELISDNINMIKAELDYMVVDEFIESLTDVMLRRTQLYLQAKNNGRDEAQVVADYIGKLKGWTAEQDH